MNSNDKSYLSESPKCYTYAERNYMSYLTSFCDVAKSGSG